MGGGRPRPRLRKRKNLYRRYMAAAMTIGKDLARQRGVVGIVLSGGVSRGYADENSETDLTIFLTPAAHDRWVNRLQAPVAVGDTIYRGSYCDFDFENIEEFRRRPLSLVERWDFSYARILHDPRGVVAALLRRRVPLADREVQTLLDFHDSWSRVWWFPDVARTWVRRGDPLAAHIVLNLSLQGILETLFVLNGELIPYDKWIGHLFRDLAWLPRNFEQTLRSALLIRQLSAGEVKRRATLIEGLAKEMTKRYRRLPLMPVEEKEVLLWLFKKRRFSLREYRKAFPRNPRTLIEDPAAKVTKKHGDSGRVYVEVDVERAQKLVKSSGQMTPWAYRMLREVHDEAHREGLV